MISRLVDGNNMLGNIMISVTMGRPIIVGVMKEENKFSFICLLMGSSVLLILQWWVLGFGDIDVLRFLVV